MPDSTDTFDWTSLLQVIVGIGKNGKQYRRLVIKDDYAFDRSLVKKAMAGSAEVKDIRNSHGGDWGDDDLPETKSA